MAEENKAPVSEAHLNAGQTTAGAPELPTEDLSKKPEGYDEAHGTPEEKAAAALKVKEAENVAKAAADKAAKEEAEKPAEKKDIDGPLTEYVTLDNEAGQGAIDVLKEAGVGPNEAQAFFAKAIASGDLKDVDWAAIEAKVGKGKAFLIKSGITAYYGDLQKVTETTVAAVKGIFGGDDNWSAVKSWAQAKEKTDAAFSKNVDAIRELIDAGGAKAEAGARELLRLYNKEPDTKGLANGKLVVGTSTGSVIGTPLSRDEYLTELKAAMKRNAPEQDLAVIRARRTAGRAQGR